MRGAPDDPVVLAVAGSDPSGGAGIQADLKTATALGVYAATVLTAVTAQNTRGVQGVHALPPEVVAAQLRSVLDDLDVAAVKIGMLGDAEVVAVVADALAERPGIPVVLDPVMVATSGDRLVPDAAAGAIVELLLPRALVVTPNVGEAELLTGRPVSGPADQEAAGRALLALGASHALVKGGHLTGPVVHDVLVGPHGSQVLEHPRVDTPHTHGTGCTLSTGVATLLAAGLDLETAVRGAGDFLHTALVSGAGRTIGSGHGPVDHLVAVRGSA